MLSSPATFDRTVHSTFFKRSPTRMSILSKGDVWKKSIISAYDEVAFSLLCWTSVRFRLGFAVCAGKKNSRPTLPVDWCVDCSPVFRYFHYSELLANLLIGALIVARYFGIFTTPSYLKNEHGGACYFGPPILLPRPIGHGRLISSLGFVRAALIFISVC